MSLETLDAWSGRWAAFMGSSLVDAAVLLAVATLVWLPLCRRASAQLGYCLFVLVLVKLVVPIPVTVRAPLAWMSPRYALSQMAAAMPTITPGAGASGASEVSAPSRVMPEVQPSRRARWRRAAQVAHLPASSAPDPRGAEADSPQGTIEERAGPIPSLPSRVTAGRDARTADAWLAAPLWSSLSFSTVLMLGWAAVVLVLLIRFGWTQWRIWVWCSRAEPLDPALLPMDLKELRRQARVRGSVRVLGTAGVPSPAVWGLLRPCLLVPPDLLRGLSPRQVTWLLLHELAHVSRGDLWVATLQRLLQIIHFFNPAVWLANWMIDRQREYACDDAALAACECPRRDCGEAFLSVVERANPLAACGAPALRLFSYRIFIRRRLLRILDQRRRIGPRRLSVGATALFLAVAAVVLPRVDAQDGAPAGRQDTGRVLAGAEGTSDSRQSDARKTDVAVAALQGIGADVASDDRGPDKTVSEFDPARAHLNDASLRNWKGATDAERLPYARRLVTDADLEGLNGIPNLQRLDLRDSRVTDAGLKNLEGLTNLQELWLDYTSVTDAELGHLEQLTGLRTLSLYSVAGITDAGLAHFKGLTNLRKLSLRCPQITDAGLKNLERLVNLEELSLDGDSRVTDAGIGHLKGLTKLQVLDLRYTQLGDAGMQHLKALRLRELALAGTEVTDAGLKCLELWPDLEVLDLRCPKISDAGTAHIQELTKLRTLSLGSEASDATLAYLEGLTNLEELYLYHPHVNRPGIPMADYPEITDAGLKHLSRLHRLRILDMEHVAVTGTGFDDLRGTNLQRLVLSKTLINDEGLRHLHGLPKLQEFILSGKSVQVTDAGLAPLKDLRNLRVLGLRGTQITDAGLRHLKGLTSLQRLDIAETKVTKAGVDDLQHALPKAHVIWGYFPGTGG
jgi:internalin A